MKDIDEFCRRCGFNDDDYGCTCPSFDKWYACPYESEKPENILALKDFVKFLSSNLSDN